MEKVGKDGVITVEEGKAIETDARGGRGHAVRQGLPLAVLRHQRRRAWSAVLENAYILIHEKKISDRQGPAPAAGEGRPDRQAAADHRRGRRGRGPGHAGGQQAARHAARCCAVKAPGFGDRRKAMLEDIAILTGGTVDLRGPRHQAGERRPRPTSARPSRSSIDKDNTTIIEGARQAGRHQGPHRADHAARSRTRPATTTARSSRSGWPSWPAAWPQINVGAATEAEMKEKKARVEDALHATRAAVEEGILPGGGVALLRASPALDKLAETLDGDEKIGVRHRPPRARGAAHADRRATPASTARSWCEHVHEEQEARSATTPRHGRVRGPGQGRHHRPDQGRRARPCRTRRPSPACC